MSQDDCLATYPPLNTLKPVADDIWIVDGPVIRFGIPGLKLPFPTRMTVVRQASADLFIHSPTPLTPELRAEIDGLGRVRDIIGPNRIHYWWIPEWKSAYASAAVYLAPRIRAQAKGHIDFEGRPLDRSAGYPWDDEIATLPVVGSYMTEVAFFHRPSRTLILTDLMENFEPAKISTGLARYLSWIGGVGPPHGGLPRDLRLTFTWRHRRELRAAVETMLEWHPERIVLAHGAWHPADGTAILRDAFSWLLRR